MCSACFPPLSLLVDAPLSSAGSSRASSPASTVLSERYDFLPSVSPRFVSFSWRYPGCTRAFAPGRTSAPPGPGVGHPVSPAGILPRREQDLPSSWGISMVRLPCSKPTPAGLLAPDHCGAAARPLLIARQRLPRLGLSTPGSMAFGLVAGAEPKLGRLRSAGRPTPRKTRFQALVRLSWTGFSPARFR